VRWAGKSINTVAKVFEERVPNAKRRLISHSAGAMAVRYSISYANAQLFDEISIFQGRDNAYLLADQVRNNYNPKSVLIFTVRGDAPGLPCDRNLKVGNIAVAKCAHDLSPQTWIHLHASAMANGSSIPKAHSYLIRNFSELLQFKISPATTEQEIDNCYSVIDTMGNAWEGDMQSTKWSHCPQP
jgi:hypothetical protein